MKVVLKILFIVFLVWMATGIYLLKTNHKNAQIVIGLAVLYMTFVLMPLFIYYRYKNGKYKKYILNDTKIKEWINDEEGSSKN
ncbi:hypothetical protein [Tenacibaculum sp. UWU-22]|uniref:hypothetical protein n=1 Tax=Tenacibaculum sp. UWU-22 TaxID=3234187 RepID=UPI0034DB7612